MIVPHLQLMDALPDGFDAAGLTHRQRGEVGVASGAIPVAGNGLGVQRSHHAEILANAMKNEAGHPHVIAALDALAGTHLILPLRWHHLRVGTADLHACVQARLRRIEKIRWWKNNAN